MNNTMPEKRVNKLGIAVTKHVRTGSKATASKTAMPAPKLAAVPSEPAPRVYKKPTKGQLKREQRSYTASVHDPDPQLLDALGLPPTRELGVYRFSASTHDLYDLMARTSIGNALAFIQAGFRSTSEAVEYLHENGMEHLVSDNPMALEAQERGIPVEDFMRETTFTPKDAQENSLFMDYMEVSGIAAFKNFDELAGSVYKGEIKLSDLRAIGATRIGKSVGWHVTEDALKKLAAGNAGFTTADVKEALERFGEASDSYIESALELTTRYGSEFTRTIKDPTTRIMNLEERLRGQGTDPARIKSILKYRDDFYNALGYYTDSKFSEDELDRFHDAGISAEDAALERVTLLQLEGIEEHGIAPSISDGWL
jgi:hypothetical protein